MFSDTAIQLQPEFALSVSSQVQMQFECFWLKMWKVSPQENAMSKFSVKQARMQHTSVNPSRIYNESAAMIIKGEVSLIKCKYSLLY